MLKAGIIGLGVGEQHIAGFRQHPKCEVRALCDIDSEKRKEIASRHPDLEMHSHEDQLLQRDDLDIISVASYDDAHHRQVMAALEKDRHVFVEKPLCLFEEEARDIHQAMQARPHLCMSSNLILRKSPLFIALKNWIHSGRFGKVFAIDADYNYGRVHKITEGWRGRIPYYSVFLGGGVHMVDLLLWLFEGLDTVGSAHASGNGLVTQGSDFKHPDYVQASLNFEEGCIARVSSNYGCVYPHFHRLSVYGSDATFVHDPLGTRIYSSRDPQHRPEVVDLPYPGYHKGDLIQSFISNILQEGAAEVDQEDIFKTMAVCFAVERSVKSGNTEKVSVF